MDFFITGFARSGTTLLSVILNTHSKIHIGKKTLIHSLINMGDNYLGAAEFDTKEAFNVNNLLGHSLQSEHRWEPFHESFLASNQLQSTIQKASQSLKEEASADLLGDKIPLMTYRIPDMALLFPAAKYVCLIRDPRSVVNSHKERLNNSPLLIAHKWKKMMISIEYYKKVLGETKVLFVRYEDLIQDTQSTLEHVCQFLGMPFEPSMIELQKNSELQKGDSYVDSFFNRSKINDWERKLKPRTVRKIERMTGDLMQSYGYELKFEAAKKNLSQRHIYWEELRDKWNYLRYAEVEGMVDQKVTKRRVPFISRLAYFAKSCLLMVFSNELVAVLNAKTKIFNPYIKRF